MPFFFGEPLCLCPSSFSEHPAKKYLTGRVATSALSSTDFTMQSLSAENGLLSGRAFSVSLGEHPLVA